jgi:arylsulfatase A-like enzyme
VKPQRGVRTEQWKLIHYYKDPEEFELHDLLKDPSEKENLYGRPEHADRIKELKLRIDGLRKETRDHP